MTKVHTIKIDSAEIEGNNPSDLLGFSAILSEAVASEGATKLTLAGPLYTQCDRTSNYN